MTAVLHVLDHSLPEQSGYAFRSHAILKELVRLGLDIDVITSPKHEAGDCEAEEVDGIVYRRTKLLYGTRASSMLGQLRTVHSTRVHVGNLLRGRHVDVVHAHSPCLNAMAAARRGVPMLYEMRSSWEDAAVCSGTTTHRSMRYRISRALETFAAGRAEEIAVICDGLKRELTSRGIPAEKVTVVPNAVPDDMFELAASDKVMEVRARFGLADAKIIGFFGSFFEWEGIDLLVRAMPVVLATHPNAKLLLVGGGRQEQTLRRLAAQDGLEDSVVFAGRINHDDMRSFYGAADVMAYPRLAHRLTEMVTPLKPLEAMAQRRPVVASDVGGHKELIEHARTGLLFPAGHADALSQALVQALYPSTATLEMAANARQVMERERRWSVVAERYLPVYARLSSGARARRRRSGPE